MNVNFSKNNLKFPLGLCSSCRLAIAEHSNEKTKNTTKEILPTILNYEDVYLSRPTRKNDICNCYICTTARFKGHTKTKKGKGHIRDTNIRIDNSNGLN